MNQQNSFILPDTKSPILQLSVVFGAVLMSASARADTALTFQWIT
jgi:hypothetical protein